MLRCTLICLCLSAGAHALAGSIALNQWQSDALEEICLKYLGESPSEAGTGADRVAWIDRLSKRIGDRLAKSGIAGVPAEDVALLALLQAKAGGRTGAPPTASDTVAAEEESTLPLPGDERANDDGEHFGEESLADVGKGQEGLRQGIEKLRELPISERMVVTGDVNAGIQALRVPDATDISTAFGRFRLNVVTRAVPRSGARRGPGYFFIQLRAAGGAFDSTSVGHPPAFSAFNDIATDRSRFNGGLARGNFYLGKAYFQQEFRFGEQLDYSLLTQFGVIDFSDFFDMNEFANNEVRQFLNSAFVNSSAYKTAIGAPGAVGDFRKSVDRDWLRGIAIRGGYAVARADRVFSSPIWSGEVELSTLLRDREGTLRFGGSAGNVAEAGGFGTFYTSADQWLSNNFGVFGRFVINTTGEGSRFFGPQRSSLSGGVQRRFVDADDHVSAWGIGFSRAWGIEADQPLQAETVIETYYRWQVTDNFALTPDLQIVNGAGGASGTHIVLGLRTNFGF